MSSNNPNGTTTIVFTFLISFLGLFGAIVFGGILWQRRHPHTRRLRFLEHALMSASEPALVLEKPLLWDVFVEMRGVEETPSWAGLLPMSLHRTSYEQSSPTSSADAPVDETESLWDHLTGTQGESWRRLGGSIQTEKSQATTDSIPDTMHDFHVSFLIAMPSPHKDLSSLQTEYALGTEQVIFSRR